MPRRSRWDCWFVAVRTIAKWPHDRIRGHRREERIEREDRVEGRWTIPNMSGLEKREREICSSCHSSERNHRSYHFRSFVSFMLCSRRERNSSFSSPPALFPFPSIKAKKKDDNAYTPLLSRRRRKEDEEQDSCWFFWNFLLSAKKRKLLPRRRKRRREENDSRARLSPSGREREREKKANHGFFPHSLRLFYSLQTLICSDNQSRGFLSVSTDLPSNASSSRDNPAPADAVPLLVGVFLVLPGLTPVALLRSSNWDRQRFETLNRTTGDSWLASQITSCPVEEATARRRAPSGRRESGQKRASGV